VTSGPLNAPEKALHIALVAGEVSGDILGAGLIKSLKVRYPNATFSGIAGPLMQEQGCEALFDMNELAVMGIVEVLGKLGRILSIRRQLLVHYQSNPPDIFIGIDAPDFNLTVEDKLHQAGIKTVHYVSPSVWAWKQKRVFKIKRACDLLLAFLPFEKAFYDRFDVPCEFVGHTMADAIDLDTPQAPAREALGIAAGGPVLAILPGSRKAEVELLTPTFLAAAQLVADKTPGLRLVVPLVNAERRAQFEAILADVAPKLDVLLVDGQARAVMACADLILLASGTAALEAMLVNRPMVVGYKVKPLTYWIAKRLVKTKYVSLPNLLADAPLVAECLQDECTPERLSHELLSLLASDVQGLRDQFTQLHRSIRCGADHKAALAVARVLEHGI
jgi:lipid-A-disaccharide synthase